MIQYGIRCPERGADYIETQKRIKQEIMEINLATTGLDDGGDNPSVIYKEVDRVDVYERTALFQLCDIYLNMRTASIGSNAVRILRNTHE